MGTKENAGIWLNNFVLGDNIPNPTSETTLIPYSLPAGAKGTMTFHDMSGRLVESHALSGANDTLELSVRGWAEGTYLYSLQIGSKTVQTKKMVVGR